MVPQMSACPPPLTCGVDITIQGLRRKLRFKSKLPTKKRSTVDFASKPLYRSKLNSGTKAQFHTQNPGDCHLPKENRHRREEHTFKFRYIAKQKHTTGDRPLCKLLSNVTVGWIFAHAHPGKRCCFEISKSLKKHAKESSVYQSAWWYYSYLRCGGHLVTDVIETSLFTRKDQQHVTIG